MVWLKGEVEGGIWAVVGGEFDMKYITLTNERRTIVGMNRYCGGDSR